MIDESEEVRESTTPEVAVGVVLIGHGESASRLLEAARGIAGRGGFKGVRAVDAGAGRDAALDARVDAAVRDVDCGRGVVVLVDLPGSSPCACGQAEARVHRGTVVSGLNLAMLCKVATIDRANATPTEVAESIASSGRRAITVQIEAPEDDADGGDGT